MAYIPLVEKLSQLIIKDVIEGLKVWDSVKSSAGQNGLIELGLSFDKYQLQEGDNVSYLNHAIISYMNKQFDGCFQAVCFLPHVIIN